MLERVLDLFVPKPGKAAGEACAPFVPFFLAAGVPRSPLCPLKTIVLDMTWHKSL